MARGKSRRIGLPHIRLHSVENVRMWIALRSHLRHQGPHTACNNIVSRTCVATLLLTLTTSVRFLEWSTERGGPAAACSSLDTDDPQTLATCAALFPAPVEVESATSGMFVLDSDTTGLADPSLILLPSRKTAELEHYGGYGSVGESD